MNMQLLLDDLAGWVGQQSWQILHQALGDDGGGVLVFSSSASPALHLALEQERSGLIYFRLMVFLPGGFFKGVALEQLSCRITATVKAVGCYPDRDGDLCLCVEGFTHDPHALPFVLPRMAEVLDHASDLAMAAALMGPEQRKLPS